MKSAMANLSAKAACEGWRFACCAAFASLLGVLVWKLLRWFAVVAPDVGDGSTAVQTACVLVATSMAVIILPILVLTLELLAPVWRRVVMHVSALPIKPAQS